MAEHASGETSPLIANALGSEKPSWVPSGRVLHRHRQAALSARTAHRAVGALSSGLGGIDNGPARPLPPGVFNAPASRAMSR